MFLYNLIDIPIVPQEELKEDLLSWKNLPIGAGPYKVVSEENRARLKLELTNPQEYPSAPKRVILSSAADSSDADIITFRPDNLEAYDVKIQKMYYDFLHHVTFNYKNELGQNADFRAAISSAINRKKLAAAIPGSVPVTSVLPPFARSLENREISQHLELSRKLLEKVGKEKFSKPLKVAISKKPVFEEISSQLAKVGITLENVEAGKNLANPEIVMSVLSVNVSSPDPILHFRFFAHGGPIENEKPPIDPRYEELIEQASSHFNSGDRMKMLSELDEYFVSRIFTIPFAASHPTIWVKKGARIDLGQQRSAISFYLHRLSTKS